MEEFYRKNGNLTECLLCPHHCRLAEGRNGICGVRKCTGNRIELTTYGIVSGYAVDPVEKKPLYHFFPGMGILSMGSYGCNMRCDFCQNWTISQGVPERLPGRVSPERIAAEAASTPHNIGLAFTYNEPIVWFEFMRDIALRVKQEGMYTVMVSNGFVDSAPLSEITGFMDAFNIDLKAFNGTFYKKLTGADPEPVKNTLRQISKAGRHLEITTLIIPGRNDSDEEMAAESKWIADELGNETPLHLSRYFPTYRRDDPSTPQSTLDRLYEIASLHLHHVYIGNTSSAKGQDTKCTGCGTIITRRSGYNIRHSSLDSNGKCLVCGNRVYPNFSFSSRQAS